MESENSFSCVLCGNKLSSKELLQEHFRKHANKEIDNKGRPITKVADKINDNKNDTEKVAVECDVCKMTFQTVSLAIQHKFRKHPESSSKFYCPFCGMQFPLKFTRDKHVQNHQGMSTLGSFPCSDCNIVFHNMGAQQYHIKSVHKRIASMFKPVPIPPPSKKIKINSSNDVWSVYYCYLCGSEYVIKFNLQKHLERSHTEEERNSVPEDLIKCTTCDALFYNKKAYDTHNIYHKPDDLYVTSEEQRLQTVTRVDQDFDIRRVQLTADKFIPLDKPKRKPQKQIEPKVKSKPFKSDLDEELSPTSSIDSTDSENDTNEPKTPKNKQIPITTEDQKSPLINIIKVEKSEEKLDFKNPKINIANFNEDITKTPSPTETENGTREEQTKPIPIEEKPENCEKLIKTKRKITKKCEIRSKKSKVSTRNDVISDRENGANVKKEVIKRESSRIKSKSVSEEKMLPKTVKNTPKKKVLKELVVRLEKFDEENFRRTRSQMKNSKNVVKKKKLRK